MTLEIDVYKRQMEGCPVKFALGLVSGKWKLRILWELNQQEVIRFNELQRRLEGISSVMLSKSLEELERARLVHRCLLYTSRPDGR